MAIDPKDGSIKTFQELSNRARKDVRLEDVKINVCIFAFDLMYYNGRVSGLVGHLIIVMITFSVDTPGTAFSKPPSIIKDPFPAIDSRLFDDC